MAWSMKGAESPSASSPSKDLEAKRNLQEGTSALNLLQKLLREVKKNLLTFKSALAASSVRFAPRSWAWALGGSPSSACGVIRVPLSSVGIAGSAQAPSALLPLLYSPHATADPPALPSTQAVLPRAQPHTERASGPSQHPCPHPTPHLGITAQEEIKDPAKTAGNPSRQAGRGIHSL